MKTIYKYPLSLAGGEVKMPDNAMILSVAVQGEESLYIWAEVDTAEEIVTRTFAVYGTGWPLTSKFNDTPHHFIGTVICGPYVWHIYELL